MNVSWLIYLNLEKEMKDCFDYIYFNDSSNQQNVYSNKFADILLRASIEIETLMKELYRINGGIKQTDKIKYDEECLEYLENIFQLSKKVVVISYPFFDFEKENNKLIYPLNHFCMTDSNEWNKSYQAVKHDKLKNYKKATLKCALHSLAALYLLNVYYKNEEFTLKHKDIRTFDNRFGSSLFSLNKPSDKTGFFSNAFISEDSVYEYKLTDNSQIEYEKEHKNYMKRFLVFIRSVPEMNEVEFANIYADQVKKFSGVTLVLNVCGALVKYRIDKKFNGLSDNEKWTLLQSLLSADESIDASNYEKYHFTLIMREEAELMRHFAPTFATRAFSESLIQVTISRLNNAESANV